MKLMYRVPEAVEASGLSRSRLYELIRSGEIHSVKVGRARLIPLKSLEQYVASLTESGPAPSEPSVAAGPAEAGEADR